MRQKPGTQKVPAEKVVKDIRRRARKQHSAEEKIRIVLDGLRGEVSVAELCRREGIAANLYYRWSKEFLEAGKKRLAGDTARQATSPEVKELRHEAAALKEAVARAGCCAARAQIRSARDNSPSTSSGGQSASRAIPVSGLPITSATGNTAWVL